MKNLFLLLLVVMMSGGLSCASPELHGRSGDDSVSESSKSLEGYWEGILPDGDFNGQQDQHPYHYVFLDIASHRDGTVSGHFYRQVEHTRYEAPLMGWTRENEFQLSADFGDENIKLSGNINDFVVDFEGEHFISDWTSSGGQSGTVVFMPVKSHIQRNTLAAKDAVATLTKDGGKGHPVIFVHGLNSDPKSWDPMIKRLKVDGFFDNHEVWRFGYNTSQPFETIGPEFLDLVKRKGLQNKAPILVGHSMGGIVSRSYIAVGGKFTKLLTLGSPHCGTPLGIPGGIFSLGALEMAPCSGQLCALYAQELVFKDFRNFIVYYGEMTGGWRTVWVHKGLSCGTYISL